MAANPFDQFDAPAGLSNQANPFDKFDDPSYKPKTQAGDLARKFKAGVQQLPGLVTGIADIAPAIATGVRPFTAVADYLGEATGFQPGKWAKETQYSDANKAQAENVDEAWKGVDAVQKDPSKSKMDYAKQLLADAPKIADAYVRNPMYTAGQVAESVPSMLAGGVGSKVVMGLGRVAGVTGIAADAAAGTAGTAAKTALPGYLERMAGEKLAAPIAAGLGEGAVTAGQQMDQYTGTDQQKNALASLGAGAGTALIGAGAGRLANKMGLETAETAMAKIGTNAASEVPMSMKRRILGGMVSEAILQELPQSAQEQVWQNYADGKPLMEGVMRQGVEGALAGAVMGGAANIRGGKVSPAPTQEIAAPVDPGEPAPAPDATPPGLGFNPSAGTHTVFPDGSVILNSDRPEGEQAVFDKRFAPQAGTAAAQDAPAATFASILDTDPVYSTWSNVQDGTDRASMRDQMEYVGRTYAGKATDENREALNKDLSEQFKWFRNAAPEQKNAALDSLFVQPAAAEPTSQIDTALSAAEANIARTRAEWAAAEQRAKRIAVVGVADAPPNSPLTSAAFIAVDSGAHDEAIAQQNQALAQAGKAQPTTENVAASPLTAAAESVQAPAAAPAAPTPQERLAKLNSEIASGTNADTGAKLMPFQLGVRKAQANQIISQLPKDASAGVQPSNDATSQAPQAQPAIESVAHDAAIAPPPPVATPMAPAEDRNGWTGIGIAPKEWSIPGKRYDTHPLSREIITAFHKGNKTLAQELADKLPNPQDDWSYRSSDAIVFAHNAEGDVYLDRTLTVRGVPIRKWWEAVRQTKTTAPPDHISDKWEKEGDEHLAKETKKREVRAEKEKEYLTPGNIIQIDKTTYARVVKFFPEKDRAGYVQAQARIIRKGDDGQWVDDKFDTELRNISTVEDDRLRKGPVARASEVAPAPARDYGDRLSPAKAMQLQEAHRALGRDVTRQQVQSMRDRVAGEVVSGQTNNGGVMVNLKPAAITQRKEQLSRLEQDLALFNGAPATPKLNPIQAAAVAKQKGIDTTGMKPAQVVAAIAQADAAPAGPVQLGRNNQPLSEGGKPYKTRLAAADAKKLQPMMRVVAVKDGFVLAEKTEKQVAAEAKAARRLRNPQTSPPGEPIPAHAFIAAEGGLHKDTRPDMNVGINPKVGNRTLFAGKGKGISMERATSRLIEEGYLSEGASHNEAAALIKKSLTKPQYNADGIERIAIAEEEARYAAYELEMENAIAEVESVNDNAFDYLNDDDIPLWDAPSNTTTEAAMAAPGFTEQEIQNEATTNRPGNPQADSGNGGRPVQAAASDAQAGDGQRAPAQGEEQGLTAPSQQDVIDQQARAKQAAQLDEKAQIDREAGKQTLTRQAAPEQRTDTSGDMFAMEKATAEIEKRNAGVAAAKDPNQGAMFSRPAANQTNTPAFKAWFGASKVVDADGAPLVVYHGTAQGGLTEFDRRSWKTAYGHFFTDDKDAADYYAQGKQAETLATYLRAENPLRLDKLAEDEGRASPELTEWINDEFDPEMGDPLDQFNNWLQSANLYSRGDGRTQDDLLAWAEEHGHDGVVFYDAKGMGGIAKSYVVFEPNQIKSSTDNNGDFDPTNPDIRFSRQDQPTTGTAKTVRTALAKRFGLTVLQLEKRRILKIWDSAEQFNAAAQPSRRIQGAAQGMWDGKVAHLFADGIEPGREVAVLLHEVGEHASMKQMLGDEAYARLVARAHELAFAGNPLAQAALERIPNDTNPQHFDSELLAYMIEIVAAQDAKAAPSARKWLADVVAAIRAWWSQTGFAAALAKAGIRMELTPKDIAALAVRAVKWQGQQGSGSATSTVQTAFSFAGQRAVTADTLALAAARKRLDAGEDADTVRQSTGWSQGADEKMRFEISDKDARLQDRGSWNRPLTDAVQALDSALKNKNLAEEVRNAILRSRKESPTRISAETKKLPEYMAAAKAFKRAESKSDAARDAMLKASRNSTMTIGDVLDHPKLFAAYPALRNVIFQLDKDLPARNGYYADQILTIGLSENSDDNGLLSDLLHEIQHGIQAIEGFATGGSSGQFDGQSPSQFIESLHHVLQKTEQGMSFSDANEELEALGLETIAKEDFNSAKRDGTTAKSLQAKSQTSKALGRDGGFGAYKHLAGEAEARNTQLRQGMTDAERRATSPESTADVKANDVIVTFNGKEILNAPAPANGDSAPMFSRASAIGDTLKAALNSTKETTVGSTGRYTAAQLQAMRNIGATVTEPSLKERAEALWKDMGKKMAQGLADQFAPIKELDEKAYNLLRLSKGASGAFESLLKGGKLKLTDNVYDFDESQRGGVIDKLLTPLQGEHHDALRWVAANRAERLMNESEATRAEGVKLLAEAVQLDADARALDSQAKQYLQQAGNFPKSMTGNQQAQKANAVEANKLMAQAERTRKEATEKRKEGNEKKNVSRENLFTKEDIAALKTLTDGTTGFDYTIQNGIQKGQVTRNRALIYKDFNTNLNGFNANVLNMATQSGLIDPESRKLWESEFYVPFYRVADESDGGVRGMNIGSGVVRQQAFKALKGGKEKLQADLMDNVLMNWAHLLDASAKNRAAKASLEAAEKMGVAVSAPEATVRSMAGTIGKKNNVVWFMDEGKPRHFLIDDPYVMTALTALEYAGMRNPAMNAMSAFKHALTIGVTASPFFKIRNLIRDSVQVIAAGPIGYNPATNIKQGWALTDPKSDAYFRLLAGGGTIHFGTMMEGNEAKRVQALVESGVKDFTILDGDHKVKAFYRKFIEPGMTAYNELGNRGEAINRAALYDQLIKQGVGHAEASLQARDLMDFSMQGSFTAVRFLTQVVPFMNAKIQGLYKLGRAANEDPKRFAAVLGAAAMFSLLLLAAYSDDDDWKQREDWDKNSYWWFKFGGEAFRIPKPFEIGAIATLAERGAELFFDKEMTGQRFATQVKALLGDNLSMNPIPQMVKPMIDVYANKDSFSGRPIETMGMEKLKPEYRFNGRTSMTARGVSTAINTVAEVVGSSGPSPVQVDHLLRGYFGWLGSFVVGTADVIARPMTNQPGQAAPDYWKTATGGIASSLEGAPSRYVSQIYQQAKEIEQAYGTWRALMKEGKAGEAETFREKNQESIAKYRQIEHIKKQTSALNQRVKQIEQSDLSGDEKRAQILRIRNQQNLIAKLAVAD